MSTIRANTIVGVDGVSAVTLARQVAAKSWVNFNGNGVATARRSFNISSLTYNGTGNYTLSFTNSFVDGSYALAATCDKQAATGYYIKVVNIIENNPPAASSVQICTDYSGGTSNESKAYIMVTITI